MKADKPTYEKLEQRVKELEKEAAERKRAEDALRESEERLQIVLDTIQAGIVVIDPEAHVIVGVNAAAGKMVGASMKRILGSGCHKYICPIYSVMEKLITFFALTGRSFPFWLENA